MIVIMDAFYLIIWITSLFVTRTNQSQIIGPSDFCLWETFKAECPSHEVVIMDSARYGRMKLGRCVRNDLGYVGCSDDVMNIADTMCSGHRKCEIKIPNPVFDRLQPCLEDLKGYMHASYRCQPVIATDASVCEASKMFQISARHGFLSSAVAMETTCGTAECPWVITGEPGQRINISLYDFNLATIDVPLDKESSNHRYKGCTKYATLVEENSNKNKVVCSTGRRLTHVYTSVGNVVEVRMHVESFPAPGEVGKATPQFLLQYQIIGCPDPPVPEGASYKREGDTALISCHGYEASWRLTCENLEWTGTVGNCDGTGQQTSQVILGNIKLPSGLSIAIIIVISLLIGCAILGVGLLCLKRQQRRQNIAHQRSLEEQTYKSTAYSEYSRTVRDNAVNDMQRKTGRELNEYASIWEWPLPPPPVQEQNRTQEAYNYDLGYQRNYRDESVSSGDHMYQIPDADTGASSEVVPRYFELDPTQDQKTGHSVSVAGLVSSGGAPPGAPRTGTGNSTAFLNSIANNHDNVPATPRSHQGHYSN